LLEKFITAAADDNFNDDESIAMDADHRTTRKLYHSPFYVSVSVRK